MTSRIDTAKRLVSAATAAIDEELSKQTSSLPRHQIERFQMLLREMAQDLDRGCSGPPAVQHPDMARQIADSWPLSHPLSGQVAEAEAAYLRCLPK